MLLLTHIPPLLKSKLAGQDVQNVGFPKQEAQGLLQLSQAPIAELKYWLELHCWFEIATHIESFFTNPVGQTKTQASAVLRLDGQN